VGHGATCATSPGRGATEGATWIIALMLGTAGLGRRRRRTGRRDGHPSEAVSATVTLVKK